MRTIYKYSVTHLLSSGFLPEGAKVLDVQVQGGEPYVWAEVETFNPSIKREFVTYGTGFDIPEDPGVYIGTFQIDGGSLVFHLYELKEPVT